MYVKYIVVAKINKVETKYFLERSSYRLDHGINIIHLRLLSEELNPRHVEYFSYTMKQGDAQYYNAAHNKAMEILEARMDKWISDNKNICDSDNRKS